ncbi:MAG: DNA topoisomerase IV subunit A [Bacilli bacterium]|nr:DNA topoisomerase IV subunit A [Bacilli bacterium]
MMSKNKSTKIKEFVENIVDENLDTIVGDRFGRYSKYIIQDRALPDVRDGLKPVQRRILYAMFKLGLFSNRPYKKSARIVGDVIGKYHPHGDTSVYEALVRLSQDFKIRLPLIDMHGNNGSIDGDPAAAMRYTEARLSKNAEYLLQDLNKRTVGFVPNFDDEEYEPIVLPAKFPNLLVNGASGISAGYATEIPPHNLDEIIKAAIYKLSHKNAKLSDLMEIVQGPDFPTGGIIQGIGGIKKAYETGRGKIIVKAKCEIQEQNTLNQIVVTEIPYDVNKAALVKKMSEVYQKKNIDGILDVRDETDREGLRIVVDLRKDINPEDILNFFLKTTELQINYNFNMVAIANKRPIQMGLNEMLDCYIDHQKEIITNRSNYELATSKKRLHIVDGLISMVSILDAVIATIRNSENKKNAIENLIATYDFSELQAEAIVMLQLYRLTNTDIVQLQEEKEKLTAYIDELNDILSNENALLKIIKKELTKTLTELSTPRKTIIEHEIADVKVEIADLIAKEDYHVIVTHDGYLKRISPKAFQAAEDMKLKDGDAIIGNYEVTSLDTMLLFTNLGNYVFLPVQKIPEVRLKDMGYNISTLVSIEAKERIIYTVPISDFEEERYLLFTTQNGLIKRTALKDLYAVRYSRALKATKIRENDELVSVDISTEGDDEVVVCTRYGYINRYDAKEISIMAPASFGVKALEMKGRPKDKVVGAHYVSNRDLLILLSQKGNIRRLRPDEIVKGRKNNVGKQYVPMTRTGSNEIISSEIIHSKNANLSLDAFIFASEGFEVIDYSLLRSATSPSGKKIIKKNIGNAEKLIITRNNDDF